MSGPLRQLSVVVTGMLVGAVLLAAIGGVVGLVLGLDAYPPTASFAVLEVGVPAGVLGGVLGLLIGLIAQWVGVANRRRRRPVDDDFAGTPTRW